MSDSIFSHEFPWGAVTKQLFVMTNQPVNPAAIEAVRDQAIEAVRQIARSQ